MTSSPPTNGPTTHTLDNGLRVVVRPDRSAPAVALNIWYDVGSRHEDPERTGLAHLFEHLMFQGSENVASGEHFGLLDAGGADLNATTWFERTNYFETLPTGALDLALWLEADRMTGLLAGLTQENLDNQRDVVKNERRERYDNQPYGTAWERLHRLAFPPGSPYHHDTIGSMEHLDAASLTECADFYRRHYRPSNAVLTLVGDISADDALARVERYFGRLSAAPAPEQPEPEHLGPLTGPLRLDLREDVPAPAVYALWRVARDGTPQADAAELALQILAGGTASRLGLRMVHDAQVARHVSPVLLRQARGDSSAALVVKGRVGADPAVLERHFDEELRAFAATGPTGDELPRARALAEREWLDETADFAGRADQYGRFACLHGDAALADGVVARLRAVTAEQVRRAAADLLPERSARVVYHPERSAQA
ncbi:M16 family metallopeptidase [Streptomyces sp. 8L]|uniref:M16 family metallopeptidase n=1 Tax=Streptomyces sp. 8L TaxID=2877242 RepID=UPI001CD792C9|nr:pitrilysin family protein [Streptomyces sp. 8L]MCA1220634.1 insulinase family protein [Streptomyces sp. 8L]